ncbi:MAG: hypothetical protein ABIR70_23815 [Bryobacteraceae bacterium]
MRVLTVLALAALFANLSLIPSEALAASPRQEIRIQSRLTGGAIDSVIPEGSARFRGRNLSTNFSVEVEAVNLPDDTKLTVTLIRGAVIIPAGELTLTNHWGEIEVNTNDGELVPQAKAGDIVVVSDAEGTAILTGVLK